MSHIEYETFKLVIEPEGKSYRAWGSSAGAGESPPVKFDLPFSDEELQSFLKSLGEPDQNADVFEADAEEFGGRLFSAVFKDALLACLSGSLQKADDAKKGLRIKLHLKDVPNLAALPWEYLYHPERRFFSRLSWTPIVRYLELGRGIQPLTITPPLRILVMIAHPSDSDYRPLDVNGEWEKLQDTFADLQRQGIVKLERLEQANRSALQDKLSSDDTEDKSSHIFHFIGHGGYDEIKGDGFLVMEDKKKLWGKHLAELLGNYLSFRLVVLNACEGGRASLTDPFGGTAQSLVRAGMQAVIAMQFPISDDAAIDFAKGFYSAIAHYRPIDAALGQGRLAMNEREWGTPVLYMRSENGQIFTRDSPSQDTPKEEPPPTPVDRRRQEVIAGSIEMDYDMMVEAIRAGELIFFIGSGANLCGRLSGEWQRGPYPPSDSELATHLSIFRPRPDEVRDLVCVSQYMALKSTPYLFSKLHDVLKGPFLTTPLHDFLASLPRLLKATGYPSSHPFIVTTNYDVALEEAFKNQGEAYDLVSYIANGEHSGKFYHKPPGSKPIVISKLKANKYNAGSLDQRPVILRLHGAVDPINAKEDSYVITEDHYVDHLTRKDFPNLLPINLFKKLSNPDSKILFLGYRMRDWNLRIIFRHIWGEKGPRNDSWALGPGLNRVDLEFWSERNVSVLQDVSLELFVEEMKRRLTA